APCWSARRSAYSRTRSIRPIRPADHSHRAHPPSKDTHRSTSSPKEASSERAASSSIERAGVGEDRVKSDSRSFGSKRPTKEMRTKLIAPPPEDHAEPAGSGDTRP